MVAIYEWFLGLVGWSVPPSHSIKLNYLIDEPAPTNLAINELGIA